MTLQETTEIFRPLERLNYETSLSKDEDTYEAVLTTYKVHVRLRHRRALYRRLKGHMPAWEAFLLTRITCYHMTKTCFSTNESLSEVVNKSSRHIKRVLNRWESQGFIRRMPDPEHRKAERLIDVDVDAVMSLARSPNIYDRSLADRKRMEAMMSEVEEIIEKNITETETLRAEIEAEISRSVAEEIAGQRQNVLEMSSPCPPSPTEKPALTCENEAKIAPITRYDKYGFTDKEVGQIGSEASPLPVEEAAEIWNEICGGWLQRVKKITHSRRRKWKARQQELEEYRTREGFAAVCQKVIRSSFLRGERSGKGHEKWKASFDFLLQASSAPRVIEGVYDDPSAPRPPQPTAIGSVSEWHLSQEQKRRRLEEAAELRRELRLYRKIKEGSDG